MTRTAKRSRDEARANMLDFLQTDALEDAKAGITRVLRDPKSPAPAVATLVVAILRSNGLFIDKEAGAPPKELHEMDGEELQRYVAEMTREMQLLQNLVDEGTAEEDPSAFD